MRSAHRIRIIICLFLFVVFFGAAVSCAGAQDPLPQEDVPEEDTRSKLMVSYLIEGEETPFYSGIYLNDPGYIYNIASPEVEGYVPEITRLSGSFPDDTEITVIYRLVSYSLCIHYRFLDGRAAASDFSAQEDFGSEYRIVPPAVGGYIAVKQEIEGVMPGRDVEKTVFYVPANAVILR